MQYFFTYNPIDGKVASYSEGLNQVSEKFEQVELEITDEQYEQIKQNYELFIKEEKLLCKKRESTIREEELIKIEQSKEELKRKLDKGEIKKLEDLLPLLSKIL